MDMPVYADPFEPKPIRLLSAIDVLEYQTLLGIVEGIIKGEEWYGAFPGDVLIRTDQNDIDVYVERFFYLFLPKAWKHRKIFGLKLDGDPSIEVRDPGHLIYQRLEDKCIRTAVIPYVQSVVPALAENGLEETLEILDLMNQSPHYDLNPLIFVAREIGTTDIRQRSLWIRDEPGYEFPLLKTELDDILAHIDPGRAAVFRDSIYQLIAVRTVGYCNEVL